MIRLLVSILGIASMYARSSKGNLLLIGGSEDRSSNSPSLKLFFELCGGVNSRIVIIPSASSDPQAGIDYLTAFSFMGANPTILRITPENGNHHSTIDAIEQADGVFFTGGDQNRLADLLDTQAMKTIIARYRYYGLEVGGSSAGASFVSDPMIAGDDTLRPGLGLLKGTIVDQHFSQRNREERLSNFIQSNPDSGGIGLDEASYVLVKSNGEIIPYGSVFLNVPVGLNWK